MICSLIVAASANDVIGADGALPWYLPGDLRRFRALTTGRALVMGRVTYQSILDRLGHPLPGRTSVVVSRGAAADPGHSGVLAVSSVEAGMRVAAELGAAAGHDEFFVIGGESVYRQALPSVDRVYLTRVHCDVTGDRIMPRGWLDGFVLVAEEDMVDEATATRYSWRDYRRGRP